VLADVNVGKKQNIKTDTIKILINFNFILLPTFQFVIKYFSSPRRLCHTHRQQNSQQKHSQKLFLHNNITLLKLILTANSPKGSLLKHVEEKKEHVKPPS
jgi:hypothetical protein